MSKSELVEGYLSGRIDRREFLKRMVSVGVSLAAAGAYAEVIAGKAASAQSELESTSIAPVITPIEPPPRSQTTDRTPTIRAKITDDFGNPRKAWLRLLLDGRAFRDFDYDRQEGLLTRRIENKLSLGKHRVIVEAYDQHGNYASEEWRFEIIRRPTAEG